MSTCSCRDTAALPMKSLRSHAKTQVDTPGFGHRDENLCGTISYRYRRLGDPASGLGDRPQCCSRNTVATCDDVIMYGECVVPQARRCVMMITGRARRVTRNRGHELCRR